MNGGKVFEVETKNSWNDNVWHSVYWEVNEYEMILIVDDEKISRELRILPPHVYNWIIGSNLFCESF